MEDAALKAVSDNVEIDIPSGMIDAEIDNMMKDIEQRLQYQGLTLAQYFTLSGKQKHKLEKKWKNKLKSC